MCALKRWGRGVAQPLLFIFANWTAKEHRFWVTVIVEAKGSLYGLHVPSCAILFAYLNVCVVQVFIIHLEPGTLWALQGGSSKWLSQAPKRHMCQTSFEGVRGVLMHPPTQDEGTHPDPPPPLINISGGVVEVLSRG